MLVIKEIARAVDDSSDQAIRQRKISVYARDAIVSNWETVYQCDECKYNAKCEFQGAACRVIKSVLHNVQHASFMKYTDGIKIRMFSRRPEDVPVVSECIEKIIKKYRVH